MKPFQDIKVPRKALLKEKGVVVSDENGGVGIKKDRTEAKDAFWASWQKSEREPIQLRALPELVFPRPPQQSGNKKASRSLIWSIAVGAILLLIFSFSGLFAAAVVKITPEQAHSIIDGEFTAKKEAAPGELSYEVMILAGSANTEVSATEERVVERKASGQVVIYNAHSPASQRLITNTRFADSDGKIYRIKDSVIVPGTTQNGNETIPGSVEAMVYADEPGEKYNIGLVDFTIPGFKGDPRYDKFYARSKTDMKGGFSGTMKFPSDTEIASAREGLKEKVRQQLIADAGAQLPSGFVLYDDGAFVLFDDAVSPETRDGNTVDITERGALHAVIFDKKSLARFIAGKSLASFEGDAVEIPNMEELGFRIIGKENARPLDGTLQVAFSGDVNVVWTLDEEMLKQNLVGVAKDDFQKAISGFPHITRAEASLRPFWKMNFPNHTDRIRVEQIIQFTQ